MNPTKMCPAVYKEAAYSINDLVCYIGYAHKNKKGNLETRKIAKIVPTYYMRYG